MDIGYQLLSEAKDMPKESQYLRVRLEMEHHRLLDWSQVAGLINADIPRAHPTTTNHTDRSSNITNSSFTDGQGMNLARNLRLERHLLLDVLSAIKSALDDFGKYQGRYRELRPISDEPNHHQGVQEATSTPKKDEDKLSNVNKTTAGVESSKTTTSKFRSRFPSGLRKKTLESALNLIDNAPQYPRRLRWVVFDAEKFKTLLNRLTELNDFLHSLMDDTQSRHLVEMQHRTHMEILQLHGSVQDLKVLIRALSSSTNNGGGVNTDRGMMHRAVTTGHLKTVDVGAGDHDGYGLPEKQQGGAGKMKLADDMRSHHHQQDDEKQHLVHLARFKAFNTSMAEEDEENSQSRLDSTRLDRSLLTFAEEDDGGSSRIEAIYEPPPPYSKEDIHPRRLAPQETGKRQVWIEWKRYEPNHPDPDHPPDPKVVRRVQQLAALLGQRNKPVEFRAPQCLGYFYDTSEDFDEDGPRFGFVFEKPIRMSTTATRKPVSLLELIQRTRKEDGRSAWFIGPSLTDRKALAAKMANCILYLHSVNWLHKGLRSHNILFFASSTIHKDHEKREGDFSDLSQPYLSGFDYARPAAYGEMTEKPPENPEFDIYRHPRVHGSGGPTEGFKKSFDIYSLGLILMEIAYWESIDRIVGIQNLARARPTVTAGVRRSLLTERKYQDGVRFAMGDIYGNVVRACLTGGLELGIAEDADETDDVVGAQLQAGFYENVASKLEELRA